jgi:hypothetical protein
VLSVPVMLAVMVLFAPALLALLLFAAALEGLLLKRPEEAAERARETAEQQLERPDTPPVPPPPPASLPIPAHLPTPAPATATPFPQADRFEPVAQPVE